VHGRSDHSLTGVPPLTREQFLEAPLVALYGCSISTTCFDGCLRVASIPIKPLAEKYGRSLQLQRVLARLRCSGCRRPPAQVTIYDHPGGERVPTWRVVLVP
jgi:hypothetical protein